MVTALRQLFAALTPAGRFWLALAILVALLGKQWGVTPEGWREAAGDYGLDGFRSVADVTDAESLARVRETKRAAKAAAKERR